MEDKPRYSRIADLIQVITLMQSKVDGVTIKDIQEEFNVSRRTAERMRDCVLDTLSQVDEIETDDKEKRWGFSNYYINELVSFSSKEIANLEKLKKFEMNSDIKENLTHVVTKLKSLNRKDLRRINRDIELLLQTEGFAIRQGESFKIDKQLFEIVRACLKTNKKLECTYHDKKRVLEPLGLIFGEKVHLIAWEKAKGDKEYNYLLSKVEDAKVSKESYDKKDFDFAQYAKQSFGTYYGDTQDVVLNFNKEAKENVLNYFFHPTQEMKEEKDGTVTVKFRASGERQILWNLFKWGDTVKIISPKKLKQDYKNYINSVLKNL